MKDVDDLLRRHRPTPDRQLRATFTSGIIDILESKPRQTRLSSLVQDLHSKLAKLPKVILAALAIIAICSLGTVAYAAYQLIPKYINITNVIQKNDEGKREYAVNIQSCGTYINTGFGSNNPVEKRVYELAPGADLSDEQVLRVLEHSCEYEHVQLEGGGSIPDEYPDPNNHSTRTISFPGGGTLFTYKGEEAINDPSLGKIIALNNKRITIASKMYQYVGGPAPTPKDKPIPNHGSITHYVPKGRLMTRTFPLSKSLEILYNDQILSLEQLQVGDTVYFVTESEVTDKPLPDPMRRTSPRIRRLVKTDVDPDYVKADGLVNKAGSLGNPSVVGPIIQLQTCPNNTAYRCIAGHPWKMGGDFTLQGNLSYQAIYISQPGNNYGLDPSFADNYKYFRDDAKDPTKQGYIAPLQMEHQIEGRVTAINGARLTLQPRGKADTFTATLPYDAVKVFNKKHKNSLDVGDLVLLDYVQKENENHMHIKPSDITDLYLIERQLPDGSFTKY